MRTGDVPGLVTAMHREAFLAYLNEENKEGSGRAVSYVRGLDLLGDMIRAVPMGFEDCAEIWSVTDVGRLRFIALFRDPENNTSRFPIIGKSISNFSDHRKRLLSAKKERTENLWRGGFPAAQHGAFRYARTDT